MNIEDTHINFHNVTPEIINRRLDIEEKKEERHYDCESCCFRSKIDKRMARFIIQAILSVSMIGFSMYKLNSNLDCNESNVYIAMISSIFSIWIPSPSVL